MTILHSEQDASDFLAPSCAWDLHLETNWLRTDPAVRKWIREMIDASVIVDAGRGGDSDSPLAFDVLLEAGVLEPGYQISRRALEFLGRRRIASLKRRFEENWSVAAEYEYCFLNFPRSSPAYVAAVYRYHYYITGNDFAAGYLWRDLECLVHGVETAAIATILMRQKAGEKGRARSTAARAARRAALIDTMEEVAKRNPDMVRVGAAAFAQLAVNACSEADPGLWSQGRGQVDEYLGEISRGEAGADLQTRYAAIFGISPTVVPFKKTA